VTRNTSRIIACDQGFAIVSMLIVVVILGVLVTVVLAGPHSSTPQGNATVGSATTTTTTPQSIASIPPQAQVSACESDYALLESALSQYQALNAGLPASGTVWAVSTANGGPFIQSWPSGAPNFSLLWNGTQLEVVPTKGAISRGSYGTSSPVTGCFAP
jgi:hypothetical protein